MDPSYLTTIGGWAAILTVGGYIYWQSQQKARKPAAGKAPAQSGKQMSDYEKNVASAATATKKKAEKALKPKSKPAAPTADTPAVKYDPAAEAAADKALNNEFARQYATAKSGTKFEAAKKDEKRQKSIKQSRAREIDAAQAQAQAQTKTSAPSSTTGDADDDLSESNSPVVPAADSRDVSDMLEQTAPGPSVLRLTDTDAVQQKPKKEKKLEVVETKKQRQNRKKAEAAKAQRAQDELERKKLEEAQRRQSRIAEGRAAKDGSAFMAANKDNNAWNPKPTNGDASASVQPLDTYEEKPAAAAPKPAAPKPAPAAAAPAKQASGTWISSMPSEEEQLKMIQDEEAWNEVTSKKKKSKQPVADSPAASTPAENGVSTSAPKAPVNGKQSKPLLTSNSSFAALTPDETANDESEVEEEWEV